VWQFPPFRLDVANQCLYRGDDRVALMPKPFAILEYLVAHAGQLVTQDELLDAIWPETHVQPEVLRRYILEIRRALGDQPDSPRFIETLTKRGYRFIAEVTVSQPEPPKAAVPENRTRTRAIVATVGVLLSGVALGAGYLWNRLAPGRPSPKNTIVLAEFANTAADPVFDGTLRQGLAVQLEQSPLLSITSEEQIQQTLRLMQRPPDTRLTRDIAAEVCQRTGGTIVLSGAIAQVGAGYNLILRATNCSNGESVASTEAKANDKSHVLEALGRASSAIREKLGESHAAVARFDTPLMQVTTSSLEALQSYSLGYRDVVGKGDSGAAIPLLQRAIELDPKFAMAYSTLGLTYWNVGETTLASENIRKAFELRAGLSELEKLRIEAEYPSLVTNNLDKARRSYETWAQTYPRDWTPRNRLGVIYTVLGQFDEAVAAYRSALELNPPSVLIRGNLIHALLVLDRIEEGRSMIREARTKNPDAPGLAVDLYRLAFLRNDRLGMKEQVTLGAANPGLEAQLLFYEADSAAYAGELRSARMFSNQAVAFANRADEKEAAAEFTADGAFREALFGNAAAARSEAEASLGLSSGPDVRYRAALALAMSGAEVRAEALADDLKRRFPEDTVVQLMYVPVLRAQVSLVHGDPAKSIEILQSVQPYEFGVGLYPAYLRGVACLTARRAAEARPEFQKIIEHRGAMFNSPVGVLAHFQIGRAYGMQGDVVNARAAYQEFLNLWRDADPGIPVLRQARAELRKINP
jgi:eukaryotic-like serine/threonine-protein kinase